MLATGGNTGRIAMPVHNPGYKLHSGSAATLRITLNSRHTTIKNTKKRYFLDLCQVV